MSTPTSRASCASPQALRLLPGKHHLTMLNDTHHQQESAPIPSGEVSTFCALVARILMRCLRERNPQVLATLGWSSLQASSTRPPHQTQEERTDVSHSLSAPD